MKNYNRVQNEWTEYKIFVLKYANKNNKQVRGVLAVSASTKLVLNYIKQAQCNY